MNSYMLHKQAEGGYIPMIKGIRRKTLVYGEKTVLCKFRLDKGTELPLHCHLFEQTGFLLSGKLLFTIDGEKHEVASGDSWCIKADVEHGASVMEDTVLIEVFSPVRKDYL
jgi:quercetin dioxygenase-like cupin family protein